MLFCFLIGMAPYRTVGQVITAMVVAGYVKLSVVVTGCFPMSVDGGVGINGLND